MRRRSFLALLLVVAACGGGSTDTSTPSYVGTYTLRTIDGHTLPATLGSGFQYGGSNATYDILTDAYTLRADGTYSRTGTARTTNGTTVTPSTIAEQGTYGLVGGSIFITGPTTALVGTLDGNTLTLTSNGKALVYTR
jgi:hypothetical protein